MPGPGAADFIKNPAQPEKNGKPSKEGRPEGCNRSVFASDKKRHISLQVGLHQHRQLLKKKRISKTGR